eukprot:SAG11_NODE_1105_length_5858_cov_3.050009_1_plen_58_part_00
MDSDATADDDILEVSVHTADEVIKARSATGMACCSISSHRDITIVRSALGPSISEVT